MEKENALKVPLKEQENLKELFLLLEQNGMEQEKKQVVQMVDYIDGIETKMEEVLSQLTEMREQLSGIENKGVRANVEKIVEAVSGRMDDAKQALENLKQAFLGKVEQALQAGKSKGGKALSGIIQASHLPRMTFRVQRLLRMAIVKADQGIEKLGNIADEFHAAKQHMGNARRALTGKKIKQISSRDPEKGVIFEIQKQMFQGLMFMEQMERRTENLLKKMDLLTARDEKARTSVRESIQELKSDQQTSSGIPQRQKNEPVRG